MIEGLPADRLGGEFGLGAVVGGVIGYAAGKMAKLLAVVFGVQLALVRFLESRGILVVHYDRLTAGLLEAREVAGDPGWMLPVVSTLSVSLGFTFGFVVGYRNA